MKKRVKALCGLAAVCLLLAAAVAFFPQRPAPAKEPSGDGRSLHEKNIVVTSEYPAFSSLAEMDDASTLVVYGKWGDFLGTYNVTRDEQDPSLESQDTYSEGRKYAFDVQQVLSGDLDAESITVGMKASDGVNFDGVELQVPSQYFYEPASGEERVLFLQFDEATGLYYAAGTPWEIAVDQGGALRLCRPGQKDKAEVEAQTDSGTYRMTVHYSDAVGTEDFVSSMTWEELKSALAK